MEVTKIEVPVVSQARAMEAAAPRTIELAAAGVGGPTTAEAMVVGAGALGTTEATVAEAEAPGTTEAMMAEAGAPGTIEANVIAAMLSAQEVETRAAEASAAPLVQGPPSLQESAREVEVLSISFDDTSWAYEMASAEVAGIMEQPIPTPGEGKLGSEASMVAEASRVEAQHLKEKAEASRVEARRWELKAKELEAEVTHAAEASVAVQTVLKTEIREHDALKGAARAACEALVVEGV
ncbi:uncharacterized protein [Miscanthus floridulus]|uniref:uncharacterized protein n=1 Tax=Miscanthus floridulus TaxID=154761 RepID=UPI0034573C00